MFSTREAERAGSPAQPHRSPPPGEVTEVTLLLPADRMKALVELSRRQGRSVAQILRTLIDRELTSID